ncbi:MAG: hypothetical protein E7458_09485 [Ruminococcaceae bacterium]|nr:hypothetical protein [Oscillospiraceae bacterium]
MTKRIGQRTIEFASPPVLIGHAAVAGKKEGEGPLGSRFDRIEQDTTLQEKSWERAESRLQREALDLALRKSGLTPAALHYLFAGDLINQCIISAYGVRGMDVPFLGLYGACSTMAEGLLLAAHMIDGGFADAAAAVTSSHFATAERQYRFPLEYGGQRPPTAQWTVTGAGAAVLAASGRGPIITRACPGKIVDYGVRDANNMGAAMAPATPCKTQCVLQMINEECTMQNCGAAGAADKNPPADCSAGGFI